METKEIYNPFEGTPWISDEEIYEFASHKKIEQGWDWTQIKGILVAKGLNEAYADSIITNLKDQDSSDANIKKKRKYISSGLSVIWAIIAVLFIRPLTFYWSPEYGRYIFIAIIVLGLAIIRQYREGNKGN